MTNVHALAAESLVRLAHKHPGMTAVLDENWRALKAGLVNEDYVDVIGQTHWGTKSWTIEQAAAFTDIHARINAGRYVRVLVEVGATPQADHMREANSAALADLPGPFVAHLDMDQNCADQDGVLEWTEPIVGNRSTGVKAFELRPGGKEMYVGTTRWLRKPGWAPLEVGTTEPSKTLFHMKLYGAVARWPYLQDQITIIVDVDHPAFL